MSHDNLRKEREAEPAQNVNEMMNTRAPYQVKEAIVSDIIHKGTKQISVNEYILRASIKALSNNPPHEGCMSGISCEYKCFQHKGETLGRVKLLTTKDIIAIRQPKRTQPIDYDMQKDMTKKTTHRRSKDNKSIKVSNKIITVYQN